MKKIYLFLIFLTFGILLSSCSNKNNPIMNELSSDEQYHYKNKDLGFELALPSEFIYYQTQRKESEDFVDLEIFVPTSDTDYPQEIQSYAKPIVVRIFNSDSWSDLGDNEKNIYEEIGEKKRKVYTIRFWSEIPKDWKDKWSGDMKNDLVKNFKIN